MSSTLLFETGSLTVLEITELARLVGQGARDPPVSAHRPTSRLPRQLWDYK